MYNISAFYKFISIPAESLTEVRSSLIKLAGELDVRGLILLSKEGFNGTISGLPKDLNEFIAFFGEIIDISGIPIKESVSTFQPFKRFKVDLRNEIITYSGEHLTDIDRKSRLSPKEWHHVLENENDILVVDTRNTYETKLGMFRGAVDPGIEKFSDFSQFVDENVLSKEKKILLYCTGGVRCEKAVTDMRLKGYENIYQLEGGILAYLQDFPNAQFEGECFVFDHRVAVDQNLLPSSRFKLCPLCGDPADRDVSCKLCGAEAKLCDKCSSKAEEISCSKNCRHHLRRKAGLIAA